MGTVNITTLAEIGCFCRCSSRSAPSQLFGDRQQILGDGGKPPHPIAGVYPQHRPGRTDRLGSNRCIYASLPPKVSGLQRICVIFSSVHRVASDNKAAGMVFSARRQVVLLLRSARVPRCVRHSPAGDGTHVTFRNAIPSYCWKRRNDMIRWLLRKAIGKFERDWNYDASYMRDMIDASPRAAWLFSR